MKSTSPRDIALATSGALSLATFLILFITNQFIKESLEWYFIIIIPVVNFVIGYIVFIVFIKQFIYRKIELIYKTIHNLRSSKKPKVKGNQDDIIEEVEQQVREWSSNKTQEIEDLKKMENYRREFIGNVSHELKTPIFNIQGYIHTLIDGGLEDDMVNRSYLHKAAKNIDRLIATVGDLEQISQFETDSLNLNISKFNFKELVEEVFDSLELQADLKDIDLELVTENSRPINVLADRAKIEQVLDNLINNSIKYGEEAGVTTVSLYDMGENILVEVSDDGIGIEDEHLPRLFERFYRVDKSRSRDEGGTGLGLAIVKHIIEAHGQTINVRRNEEKGTTFGFTLKKA